jgi:acyl dehydratase
MCAEDAWLYGRITDEAIATLRTRIGVLEPMGQESEPVTVYRIMRYINGIGDDNPLWFDEAYAARTRWGGIIAPPTFLHANSTFSPRVAHTVGTGGPGIGAGEDPLPGVFAMVTGERIVFYQPLRVGDTLRTQGALHDVIERRSTTSGRSLQLIRKVTYYNQRDEVVAVSYPSVFRMEREQLRNSRKYLDMPLARYTKEQMEEVYTSYEHEHLQRRGANPRYWEDTELGESLITLVKGPLTITNIIAFCQGWLAPGVFANRLQHIYLKNHPRSRVVNIETNIEDDIVAAHWDTYLARQSGIPYPYDEGIMRIGWLAHLLTDWMGDDGFLRELDVTLRRPNMLNDLSWCTGRVTGKRVDGNQHLVDVEVWITNQRGERTAVGTAVVELPSRVGS